MKIISFYNEELEQEYLKKSFPNAVFLSGTVQDHTDLKDEEVDVLSVFVNSEIGTKEMNQFPNLKFIATRSTGFDHIDIEEAKKRGIVVSNVPTYGANTVAEQAFALLLSLSRRIYESYDRVLKEGSFRTEGLRGFDLRGKIIGIVGTGNIGSHMARMARGFEMEVVAFDINENDELKKHMGVKYVSFDELLSMSDIISLHTPYNEHTRHLINSGNINKIKNGTYIINTARGGLIETKALVMALKEGIVAGAGLDVLEEEEYMLDDMALLIDEHPNPESLRIVLSNQYLIDHPQVIITPHNAFNTQGAIERILDVTIENIKAFNDNSLKNIVS